MKILDNPLRYDFEQARTALGGLNLFGFSINALQLLIFAILPLFIVGFTVSLVTRDYRLRTLKVRCAGVSLSSIRISQFLAALCVSVLGSAVAVVTSVSTGLVAKSFLQDNLYFPLPPEAETASSAELGKTFVLYLGFGFFYCALGWALGLVTRRALVPTLFFSIWFITFPILSPFDPRTATLSVVHNLLRFSGSFDFNLPISTPAQLIAPLALGYLAVFFCTGILVSNRVSRYN